MTSTVKLGVTFVVLAAVMVVCLHPSTVMDKMLVRGKGMVQQVAAPAVPVVWLPSSHLAVLARLAPFLVEAADHPVSDRVALTCARLC